MCRAVVSIAMESPFTIRRTRLFCHLGAHRRSAARALSDSPHLLAGGVAELQIEALQVGLREWRGEVHDEVRLYLKHPAKSPWGRIDDDVEALPSVPVRLQIEAALYGPSLAAHKGGEPARSRLELSHPHALRWERRVHRGYGRPKL